MDIDDLQLLLWATALLLALALGLIEAWQALNRAKIGPVRWRVRRRRGARAGLMLAALGVAASVVSGSELGRTPAAIAVLALSLALIGRCPGFQDSIWGERGVQRGWYARRLEDLEAWRLIGEHLRWKLFGEWVATDVPAGEHALLREQLLAKAAGRESTHGNAGLDPQRIAAAKSNSATGAS